MVPAEDAERLFEALALPAQALVERRVAKSLLAERGGLAPADRRAAEAGIERLNWRATLQPSTVAVPAYADEVRDYAQIVVMAAALRPGAKEERLVEVIHRAVAHPLLLVCEGPRGATLSAGPKRRHEREAGRVVVERIATSPSLGACAPENARAFLDSLALPGVPAADLWSLHEAWAGRIEAFAASRITGRFRPPADIAEAAARRAALAAYEAAARELARLRRAAGAERRLSVRIDLANAASRVRADLEQLKADLT